MAADLAKRLGWHYLDSGALYRIVAAVALTRGIDLDAATALAKMAAEIDVRFEQGEVYVDGENLTDAIRREEISIASSQVAALPGVRNAILTQQHKQRRAPGLVADGRDMGTVVFRDAGCKIFLDAQASFTSDPDMISHLGTPTVEKNIFLPAALDGESIIRGACVQS